MYLACLPTTQLGHHDQVQLCPPNRSAISAGQICTRYWLFRTTEGRIIYLQLDLLFKLQFNKFENSLNLNGCILFMMKKFKLIWRKKCLPTSSTLFPKSLKQSQKRQLGTIKLFIWGFKLLLTQVKHNLH